MITKLNTNNILLKVGIKNPDEKSFLTDSRLLVENGMSNYLKNLEDYEDKLASGEIKW
jgi:hypothetical protein